MQHPQQNELDKVSLNFTQFIILINTGLIGYTIKFLENKVLEYKFIPLALAILCWALSFLFGITSIRRVISSRIVQVYKDGLKNQELIDLAMEECKKIIKVANKHNLKMYFLLYCGIVSFLIWKVIDMI